MQLQESSFLGESSPPAQRPSRLQEESTTTLVTAKDEDRVKWGGDREQGIGRKQLKKHIVSSMVEKMRAAKTRR